MRYSILTTLFAYSAWLRSEEGTRWLLALYGIEIISPHPGYAYYYEGERLVEPQYGLRIYNIDRSARTAKSPDEFCGLALVIKLKELLERRRGPSQRPPLHASDGMWRWMGSLLRNWLTETKPDLHWPTSSSSRIAGYFSGRAMYFARTAKIASGTSSTKPRRITIVASIGFNDRRMKSGSSPAF